MYSTDWEFYGSQDSFWRQYKLHPQDGTKSQLKPAQGDNGTELNFEIEGKKLE